ncbi:MAG: sulfite dehydrogenase, partial [Gammaproteobacteria bacterium]|nr:sulfite dehydrogenase [Gammaproteobacteria bacterium]
MAELTRRLGRLRPAPENFLSEADLKAAREGRRRFLRTSLMAAGAAAGAPLGAKAGEADPAIVNLPPWTTSPGSPVAARPYGSPSRHRSALQRRELPGLSPVG